MAGPVVALMAATDELYLDQRMQRWAGVTDTAVCFDRVASNPMLDDRFIAIARSLPPGDKRNSIFLSRLQLALDDELAHIPLDGRPAPVAYATRSIGNSTRQITCTMRKAARNPSLGTVASSQNRMELTSPRCRPRSRIDRKWLGERRQT